MNKKKAKMFVTRYFILIFFSIFSFLIWNNNNNNILNSFYSDSNLKRLENKTGKVSGKRSGTWLNQLKVKTLESAPYLLVANSATIGHLGMLSSRRKTQGKTREMSISTIEYFVFWNKNTKLQYYVIYCALINTVDPH